MQTTQPASNPSETPIRIDVNGRHGWKTVYSKVGEDANRRLNLKQMLLPIVRIYDETEFARLNRDQSDAVSRAAAQLYFGLPRREGAKGRDLAKSWGDEPFMYLRIDDGLQAISVFLVPISEKQFLTEPPPFMAPLEDGYSTYVDRVVAHG